MALFNSCKEIAYKIRTASCDKMACFNEFGDEQLAIDILANNVLFQVCAVPRLCFCTTGTHSDERLWCQVRLHSGANDVISLVETHPRLFSPPCAP